MSDSPSEGEAEKLEPGVDLSSEGASAATESATKSEAEAQPETAEQEAVSSQEVVESVPPPVNSAEGSHAQPLRAMRVIKLSQSKAAEPEPYRMPSSSAPAIETSEASLEDLEDVLDEAELSELEPTPAPPSNEEGAEQEAESSEESEPSEDSEQAEERQGSEPEIEMESEQLLESLEPPHVDDVELEPTEEEQAASEASQAAQSAGADDFEVPPAERKPPPPRRSAKPSLPQAQKPRSKPWWETLFGDDFSRAYRPMSASQLKREVDFIENALALPRGSVILDLGCGQGEICVELARRGYSVVGYDLSVYQLAMAGDNAQEARQKINFLQGDMREMAFEAMFDGVLCWDTSFGYFEEDKNLDVLHRIRTALKPGGRFVLDIMNRDFAAKEAPYSHWFEGDGCVCMDDMNMDWITNRLKVKRSIILDDGRSKELQYSVRLYGLSDVGRMMHDVGFRVSSVSGDVATKGAFFGPTSRRIIIESGRP